MKHDENSNTPWSANDKVVTHSTSPTNAAWSDVKTKAGRSRLPSKALKIATLVLCVAVGVAVSIYALVRYNTVYPAVGCVVVLKLLSAADSYRRQVEQRRQAVSRVATPASQESASISSTLPISIVVKSTISEIRQKRIQYLLIAFAAASATAWNWYSLQTSNSYYFQFSLVGPFVFVVFLACAINPNLMIEPRDKNETMIFNICSTGGALLGALDWYLMSH